MSSFEYICTKRFNEINNNVSMYKHSSGIRLYYYPNMTSNSFGIVIRTKGNDTSETGHILEHMLCRGNKDDIYFDLSDYFKKYSDTKFGATTSFSNIHLFFESKKLDDYFGLAETLLKNVLKPSLLKEDFLIEGYSVKKNAEGKPFITGRVYNEVKNKNTRDIDVYRNFIVNDVNNENSKDILSVSFEDVLEFYKENFIPENMIIIASGNYIPEMIIDDLEMFLDRYELSKQSIENIKTWEVKSDKSPVYKEFINVKESNKTDISLFYKINNLSYREKIIASIVLDYIKNYKLDEIEEKLNELNKGLSLSSQIILDEKKYNFFNIRLFDVLDDNVQDVIDEIKKLVLNVELKSDDLKKVLLGKLIEADEKTENNPRSLKELISYLVSSKFKLEDYEEDVYDKLLKELSNGDTTVFEELFKKLVSDDNLFTYIFKNKTLKDEAGDNLYYDEKNELLINNYIEEKERCEEEVLNNYLKYSIPIDVSKSALLDTDEYAPKRKYKETEVILSNSDVELTFEKDYLIYLLSLKLELILDDLDYILEFDVKFKNRQITITTITDNNVEVEDRLLTHLKNIDLNNDKDKLIALEKKTIECIKNAFKKLELALASASNMARLEQFNSDAICHLELEDRISKINEIDLNEIRDYLLEGKILKSYDIKKVNHSNVLLLTNRNAMTSIALNVKDLNLSEDESDRLETIIKDKLDVEVKQKRGLYGYYVQCSYGLLMIAFICDNDYQESMKQVDLMMNEFLSNKEIVCNKLADYFNANKESVKKCIVLNKKNAQYDKSNFDYIYEFND